VVAPGEFNDLGATGGGARQAQRAHRRLGAGGDEAHHLHTGNNGNHFLGELGFQLGRRAEARAASGGIGDRRNHTRFGVPENERSPGEHVIDVLVAVDIK